MSPVSVPSGVTGRRSLLHACQHHLDWNVLSLRAKSSLVAVGKSEVAPWIHRVGTEDAFALFAYKNADLATLPIHETYGSSIGPAGPGGPGGPSAPGGP